MAGVVTRKFYELWSKLLVSLLINNPYSSPLYDPVYNPIYGVQTIVHMDKVTVSPDPSRRAQIEMTARGLT